MIACGRNYFLMQIKRCCASRRKDLVDSPWRD